MVKEIHKKEEGDTYKKKYILGKEDIYSKKTTWNKIIQKKKKRYTWKRDICKIGIYTGDKISLRGRTYTLKGLYKTGIIQKKQRGYI